MLKKYRFSGENRLFRRFSESSGYKNQFYWQWNHAWWLALLSITFSVKKQSNIRKKSDENLQKRRFPAYFRHFRPEKIFLKNRTRSCFEHCYGASLSKKSEKTNDEISRECQKIGFSGIFGRKNMFYENRAPAHFRYCHLASVCKISWKNIKYSLRNSRNTVFPAKIGYSGNF